MGCITKAVLLSNLYISQSQLFRPFVFIPKSTLVLSKAQINAHDLAYAYSLHTDQRSYPKAVKARCRHLENWFHNNKQKQYVGKHRCKYSTSESSISTIFFFLVFVHHQIKIKILVPRSTSHPITV